MKPTPKKVLLQTVRCAACNHSQPDEGQGKTCVSCGCSPLPSYDYPKGNAFYPREQAESDAVVIGRLIKQRQAR